MPAIDENITNADKSMSWVSSCRFQAPSTLARNTASTRSGVNERDQPVIEHSGGMENPLERIPRIGSPANSAATASRSATSQAATETRAPASSSSAHQLGNTLGAAPLRLANTTWATP